MPIAGESTLIQMVDQGTRPRNFPHLYSSDHDLDGQISTRLRDLYVDHTQVQRY